MVLILVNNISTLHVLTDVNKYLLLHYEPQRDANIAFNK
jgi:hypothetical protein